jgi:hypothetical protein
MEKDKNRRSVGKKDDTNDNKGTIINLQGEKYLGIQATNQGNHRSERKKYST